MTLPPLPDDHADRLRRAEQSLAGLSVGDAFGAQFFLGPVHACHFPARIAPPGPWRYTDDTEMALGVVEVLRRRGRIDADELAEVLARRYARDIYRGYGVTAHQVLAAIEAGTCWRIAARAAFNGEGSLGNGAAMRVAPLGAYFADDPIRTANEARLAAGVTHAHPEGVAGAVAVASAAGAAWRLRGRAEPGGGRLLRVALDHTPAGATRDGLARALGLGPEVGVTEAAKLLGNGRRTTAADTVPFALWCADRNLGDYSRALWDVIAAGGDVDTLGAIVGGVVALTSPDPLPPAWVEAREPLDAERSA